MITIITSFKNSSGAVEFERAARSIGMNVSICEITDPNVASAIDSSEILLLRISPNNYPKYQQLENKLQNTDKLRYLRNTLAAFDKCRSFEVLDQASVEMPLSMVLTKSQRSEFLPGVVKVARGNQGKGVYLVTTQEEYDDATCECLLRGDCLYQEYIPESKGRDKRIIVCRGTFVAAMQRVATGDDFRANLHLGGSATAYEPTEKEIELACRATEALGLEYGGVDIIDSKRGPLVLEVNPSPGLSISKISGVDVAKRIIELQVKGDNHD